MKLQDSIKHLLNVTFVNCMFISREPKDVLAILNIGVKGSNNMRITPEIDRVEVEHIDEVTDKLTLIWDDYQFEGIVSWRRSENGKGFIFKNLV